jgi:hypothetical protein
MFSNLFFFYLKFYLVMLNIGWMYLLRTCFGKFLTITRDIGNNLEERFLEHFCQGSEHQRIRTEEIHQCF